MLKKITICFLILICFISCIEQSRREAFLSKYAIEDFSPFKELTIVKRGGNHNEYGLALDSPCFVNDTLKTCCYFIRLDKKSNQVIRAEWTTETKVTADTLKLQELAQVFIKYEIPRLDVDIEGNVFVYLKDIETLSMAQFADNSGFLKHYHQAWTRIKGNWYKPN